MSKEIIYSNEPSYLWDMYGENAREIIESNEDMSSNEDDIWNEIQFLSNYYWEGVKSDLEDFFDAFPAWVMSGILGLWNGHHKCGTVFNSWNEFSKHAFKDCEFCEIYEEKGRLFIESHHHNGVNTYEIKRLNDFGQNYYDANYDYIDLEVIETLFNKYAVIPHYTAFRDECENDLYSGRNNKSKEVVCG